MKERRKNRRSIDIIANILEVAKEGNKKTRIMYLASLSPTQLNKYLELLINKNLLEYNSNEENYKTTDKGIEFLKNYYDFKEIENAYRKKLEFINEVIK